MRYILAALFMFGCSAETKEVRADTQPRAQAEEERYEQDVCASTTEVTITKVGSCSSDGWCGVMVSAGVSTGYCVLKYPVEGAKLLRCFRYEKRLMTQSEYDEHLEKIGSYATCKEYPEHVED